MSSSTVTDAPAVRASGLSKTFVASGKAVHALSEIELTVPSGRFVSIIGPSGCGKSTLLMILAGLARADAGSVHINGAKVDRPATDIGIVFQSDLLLAWRTVLQNVMLQVEMRRLGNTAHYKQRAMRLLDAVGLGEFADAYPHQLSGGMRQRASICRALVHDASLLVMDEPFGALDALVREQMGEMLLRLLEEEGKTVVFVTHDIAEAVFLSDEVYAMSPRPGRIVQRTTIELGRPRPLSIKDSPQFIEYQRTLRECLR